MSVLTEINRIKDAVTAIVNAIKGKGVTVPANAKIDDLAPLISSIQSRKISNVTFDFDEILPVLGNKEIVISYTRDDGVGNILTVNTNTSFEALRKTPIFIYIPVSGVAEIYEAVEKMVHNNGNTYIYYADEEQKVLSFYLDD